MRIAILLWAAALGAQTRDIPFEGNVLHADKKADLVAGDHRVEVRRGTVVFHLTNSGAPPVEIATPCVTVHPYFLGSYRIEVQKSGESTITPIGAEVKVASPLGAEWVQPGKKMIARGPAANPEFRIVSAKTGWRWIGEMLASMMRNGGGAAVDVSAGSSNDDSSQQSSKPAASAAPASSSGKGPDSYSHGDSRVATSPGRGK